METLRELHMLVRKKLILCIGVGDLTINISSLPRDPFPPLQFFRVDTQEHQDSATR